MQRYRTFLVGFDMYHSIWQRIMRETTRNVNITSAHKLHTGISECDARLLFYHVSLLLLLLLLMPIIFSRNLIFS